MAVKVKSRTRTKRMKERKKRLSAWGILLIVLAVLGVSAIGSFQLSRKNRAYQQREEALQESIDDEKERKAELEELEAYTKTKKYVEDVAKDKLGLVYEDEIIYKASE